MLQSEDGVTIGFVLVWINFVIQSYVKKHQNHATRATITPGGPSTIEEQDQQDLVVPEFWQQQWMLQRKGRRNTDTSGRCKVAAAAE